MPKPTSVLSRIEDEFDVVSVDRVDPGQGIDPAAAIAASNRAMSDVAGEYQVSWRTSHKALLAAAAQWLPEPAPTTWLRIDETPVPVGPLNP